VLNQSNLHFQLAAKWGQDNEVVDFTISDIARLFAILAHDDFESERSVILGVKPKAAETVGGRVLVDDPSFKPAQIWARVKEVFHDVSYPIQTPDNWIDAIHVQDYRKLLIKDSARCEQHVNRSSDSFKKYFMETLRKYRKYCKNYRSETGNGSGKAENFMDWNEDEDLKFQNYTMSDSPALFTFIFMLDRQYSYIFEAEHDGLGDNAAITGSEDLHNRAAPRSSPTMKIDNLMSDVSRQMSSVASIIAKSLESIDTPPVVPQLSERQAEDYTITTDLSTLVTSIQTTTELLDRGKVIAQNLSNLSTDTLTGEKEKEDAKKELKRQLAMNEGFRKIQNKMFKSINVDLGDDDN
jgi:hypothetical protein